MKKLLTILLTLAMLLPMCGLAEETAPGATETTISFADFNAKALLGADVGEQYENAINDLLDALRVVVYQQGKTSAAYEVRLNDQTVLEYAMQLDGADFYQSGDLFGATVRLNLDEDMHHLGELIYRQQLSQRGITEEAIDAAIASGYYAEQIAQVEELGALVAKVAKNPVQDVLTSLAAIDFAEVQRRMAEYQPSMTFEPVAEQPEGGDPAEQVCTFTLTNEQLVNQLAILLETALQVPAVQNFADLLAHYDNLTRFLSSYTLDAADTDWAEQVRQQTILPSDAQVTMYTNAQGQLVKLIVSYRALPKWAERMPRTMTNEEILNQILNPATFTLNMNTVAGSVQYDWALEKEEESTTGTLAVTMNRRGVNIKLAGQTTSETTELGKGWEADVLVSGLGGKLYREASIRILSGGEVGLGINMITRSCEPRALLSDGDVLDLGEISSAQFNEYVQGMTANLSQITARVMANLPQSVLALLNGTGAEGGITE